MSPSPLSRASSLASSRRENPTARFFSSRRAKIEKKKMTTTRTNAKSEEDEDDAQKRKNPDLYCAGGEEWEKEEEETEAQRRRQSARKKPDVLAPAGGWPQLEAAVRNGANCVYFGLELLNARARANNFTIEELPRVMNYLRERGVKGYVTMNVLIFDDEMSECERLIRACAKNGVDALIVQDVGAARLVKRVAPNMAVHGSTQMSITDANGALFAKEIGCERVVVGRELSISEIKTVVERSPETTVEAFTHGALCVSYSGQCFSSEAWGGRSANRGQCAQACRMPYGFVVNGEIKAMGDEKYLLSPQDLMAVDLVPQLIDAGVSCFKIEGRLKGEEYVGLTTAAYRRAVDLAWENRNVSKKELLTDESRLELRQVFARAQDEHFDGLTTGFLEGTRHQTIVRGRNPRHRGVFAGRVVEVDAKNERVTIQTTTAPSSVSTNNDGNDDNSSIGGVLKRGFGVVFDDGTPELDEQGGFIYEIFDERGSYVDSSELCSSDFVTLAFARNSIDYWKIRPGNIVWRTSTTSGEKKEQHRKKERSEEVLAKTSSSGWARERRLHSIWSARHAFENCTVRYVGERRGSDDVRAYFRG
jgi:putative protease